MMAAEVRWLWLTVLLGFICGSFGNAPFRRFEYKYSFKPPYLAQKDGSVPFWEYGGNAIASSENVRIAPSLRSQKGAIWTKSKTNFDWWEVDIVFRISGRGRLGADGLAFWYTENRGSYDGQVFGSSDKWNGLGIFFDSFDNDNKHNNPYIMAVVNDGTKEFDHQQDGQTQLLAGCVRDFRNKPFPSRARIEYYQNVLTVFFHTGLSNNELDSDVCLRVENVFLPKTGFFGLSAATGGLADDHDVMHFLATSLHTPGHVPPPVGATRVSEEEQKKLSEEYADYQRKLDQQKEEYRREHPEAAKDKESEFDELFESDNQRELRQIFMGQSETYDKLREIDRKLDEVVGRQERTISLISTITTAGGSVVRNEQYPQISDTIKRHEVDAVLTNQNNIISASKDLKNLLLEIHSRTETIIQTQAKQPTAQVQPLGGDTATLASLVAELREAAASQRTACNCSTAGCLSVTVFLVFAAVQLLIILGYNIYKDSREAQAKKFY